MKRHAPATARNSAVIAEVLAQELPDEGLVLEVASGTGEHAVFFARRFPNLHWQPSDRQDEDGLASITAWSEEAGLANLKAPLALDATEDAWPIDHADAVLCINMVHISPWEATVGLFRGGGNLLHPGAPLILYGPYREKSVPTAQSNIDFEVWLKQRDTRFGVRQREDVDQLAIACGFELSARYEMPAKNLTLVYRRT